jgi:hypothetical protein
VTRRLAACFAIATLGGCELVVDDGTRVLVSADASRDSGVDVETDVAMDEADPPVEAGLLDANGIDVGTGQDCSSGCLNEATSCQQACAATEATCLSGCHGNGNGACQGLCTQQEVNCDSECSNQCVSCFMKTMCAGPNACTK